MKAVVYHKKGSPDKLIYQEVETPVPGDQEVLVKVYAVSLNAADYRMMKLGMPPKKKIFGSGIAGTVVSVGPGVSEFSEGDAIIADLADSGFGGLAEYAAVHVKDLALKPEGLSFEAAATLPIAAPTALKALQEEGNLQSGQKVLILGSSGGVGIFALQLAKHLGGEVTAVCSTRNVAQSKELGADRVIDYKKENILKSKERFDLILAINGNYSLLGCQRLLSPGGTYVMVGGSYGQIFKPILFGWLLSLGSKKIRTLSAKSDPKALEFVTNLLAHEHIQTIIEKRFPLDETAEAMRYVAEGHVSGKVVIEVVGS